MLMRFSLYCLLCSSCSLASASQISTSAQAIKKSDTATPPAQKLSEQEIAQKIFNLWATCTWDKDFDSIFKQSIALIRPDPSKVRKSLQDMIEKNIWDAFTETYYNAAQKPEYALAQLIYILGIKHLEKLYEPVHSPWKQKQKGTMIDIQKYREQLENSAILQTFNAAEFKMIISFFTCELAQKIKSKAQ